MFTLQHCLDKYILLVHFTLHLMPIQVKIHLDNRYLDKVQSLPFLIGLRGCFISLYVLLSFCSTAQDTWVKATYLYGDLLTDLQVLVTYPFTSLQVGEEGDVILTLTVAADGSMQNVQLLSSPFPALGQSALAALQALKSGWKATEVAGDPVAFEYLAIFRFRRFLDTSPPDFLEKARRLSQKSKYEKAMKWMDKAIEDNPHAYQHYAQRSALHDKLGNLKAMEHDSNIALQKEKQIMAVVDVFAAGRRRTSTRSIRSSN